MIARKPFRHTLHRLNSPRHILAHRAITTGQSPLQEPPFINNRDRGAIELQLRHQVGILPRQLMNPSVEVQRILPRIAIGERKHRVAVLKRRSFRLARPSQFALLPKFTAHPLCGRIGSHAVGILLLQRLQLLHQEVKLLVTDGRGIQHIVLLLIPLQKLSKLCYPIIICLK